MFNPKLYYPVYVAAPETVHLAVLKVVYQSLDQLVDFFKYDYIYKPMWICMERECVFVKEHAILYKMTDWIVINVSHIPFFSPLRATTVHS